MRQCVFLFMAEKWSSGQLDPISLVHLLGVMTHAAGAIAFMLGPHLGVALLGQKVSW